MSQPSPELYYQEQKERYQAEWNLVSQKRKRIAWQRLLIVLLTFILLYLTWSITDTWVILCELIVALALFLVAVSADANAKSRATHLQHLLETVEKERNILQYNFRMYEDGKAFLPAIHPYATDLDIFGDSSLYQYVSRCQSQQGKALLAGRLLSPLSKNQAIAEQEAVSELAGKMQFREEYQASGMASQVTQQAEEKIKQWIQSGLPYTQPVWKLIAILFPLINLSGIFLFLTDYLSSAFFSALLFISYLVAFLISKKISAVHDMLSAFADEADVLYRQLQLVEEESFTNEKMLGLQSMLKNAEGVKASQEIRQLAKVLNLFNIRLNTFAFLFLNTLFLWDLQQVLSLHRWKKRNQGQVTNWFPVIAETEVVCSFAALTFNHPDWCRPVITDDFFTLEGRGIGHPLLPATKCITNDFSIDGRGKIAVITGSNMGGKSTFLRSLGVNMVLALAGAPVFARSFRVSPGYLMSSMRIADNLSESTSTFYAELKKLKSIIEAVNSREPVFILLDEILRGTNSLDRHTGSVALLKQLLRQQAVAVIATHDVELAALGHGFPDAIRNYHFDVQTRGNELYFDYKLKEGICRSMNASVLMKNIGIEID